MLLFTLSSQLHEKCNFLQISENYVYLFGYIYLIYVLIVASFGFNLQVQKYQILDCSRFVSTFCVNFFFLIKYLMQFYCVACQSVWFI